MGSTWELLYGNVRPAKVRYCRSIVSYLDILGFRELIETKKPGEISRILRVLGESVKPDPMFKSQKILFTKFSDTVIRSMPVGTHYLHNLIWELRSVLYAQIALIPQGILVRGAVTIGDVVQSWGCVYGPGVVRAYELESCKGAPPRIIVDNKVLSCLQPTIEKESLDSELNGLVRKEESIAFLDYLRACETELNVPEQEYPIFLAAHRDLIRSGLTRYDGVPQVLPKYQWLRDYHEHTLQERFGADIPSHLRV
ncbi:MAG TPA: hypothetical protein VN937_10785 [Blastocatellia bacterium]|nr:hypothetical protein [Blastocatellia bacterium]